MKRVKFALGLTAIIVMAIAIFFVLRSDQALVIHPKGIIAHGQLNLIKTITLLMLIVVVPTFILLFTIAWKYRAKNGKAKYSAEQTGGVFGEVILWIIPTVVIAVMATITWKATHQLDPYRPIEVDAKPLTIQVVALNWKWLFIYPEQRIATVNFVQFPARTEVHFQLTADASPMNSFWIPQLSGQIYAMSGMTTQLHIMADEPGMYTGSAAEINGKGLADMTFIAKASSFDEFEDWVASVKQSPLLLTDQTYQALVKPSLKNRVTLYGDVEKDLFNHILMKYKDQSSR